MVSVELELPVDTHPIDPHALDVPAMQRLEFRSFVGSLNFQVVCDKSLFFVPEPEDLAVLVE